MPSSLVISVITKLGWRRDALQGETHHLPEDARHIAHHGQMALALVDGRDRNFDETESEPGGAHHHLGLHLVSAGAERRALQHLAAEQPKAALTVTNALPGDGARPARRQRVREPPRQRHGAGALPGPEHHVGAIESGSHERWNALGRVLTVGVQRDHGVEVPKRLESGAQRCTLAAIARERDHTDARIARHLRGGIARAVVHHQHVRRGFQRRQPRQHVPEPWRSLIGRDQHRHAHQRTPCSRNAALATSFTQALRRRSRRRTTGRDDVRAAV
jgi:hypothetical protein